MTATASTASTGTDLMVDQTLSGIGLGRCGPVSMLPTGPGRLRRAVLRVPVRRTDGKRFTVVLKQVCACRDEEVNALIWEHQVGRDLHAIGETLRVGGAIGHNPVPALLHERPLTVPTGSRAARVGGYRSLVSVRMFIEATSVLTPRTWGQLIGLLHVVGSHPAALRLLGSRPANVLFGLDAEHLLRTVGLPAHPFHGDTRLLQRVAATLRERAAHALTVDAVPLVVHRDLHPLNLVVGRDGPVAIDWAEAGWGTRSDDFAWLYMAVARLGAPRAVLAEARAGYEDVVPGRCPSAEQIRAAGQVRELICLAFSIQNAGLSAAHRHEAQLELAILDDPDAATALWTPLFNQAAFAHPALGRDRQRWAS